MLPNKNILTPGPWSVNGNTVKDGYGNTICVVFARNATAHAHWIAEIPKLANRPPEPEESEVRELRETVARLEDELESREAQLVELKDALTALTRDGMVS